MRDCNATLGMIVADRLRQAMLDGQTVSIGIACWDGTETPDQLLTRVDQSLGTAKQAGRDIVIGSR